MSLKLVFVLTLVVSSVPLSFSQLEKETLSIKISEEGVAKITQTLTPLPIISRIQVSLVSDKISNVVATDENNSFLNTEQINDMLTIDTLGSSFVTLKYDAQIVSKTKGIWNVSYHSNMQSIMILPESSNIVSVNIIPTSLSDNSVTMPPGNVSITYTIKPVKLYTFDVSNDSSGLFLDIMTVSDIQDFKKRAESISFKIDSKNPTLIIIPKTLFSGEHQISLNEEPIRYSKYENATHHWIRIEPISGGLLEVSGTIDKPADIPVSEEKTQQIESKEQKKEEPEKKETLTNEKKTGGCLIATAAYGTEMSSQVQLLREVRDNAVFGTNTGTAFMTSFNQFYYSFSPTISDWERQSPIFKEAVKAIIMPMLSSLSILNYVSIDSEQEMIGYGIGIILFNVGIYIAAPIGIIVKLRRKLALIHKKH